MLISDQIVDFVDLNLGRVLFLTLGFAGLDVLPHDALLGGFLGLHHVRLKRLDIYGYEEKPLLFRESHGPGRDTY